MKKAWRSLLVCGAACVLLAFAPEKKPDYDIYLFIGQSNCAGRGYMLAQDSAEVLKGVWLLNAAGVPEPATAPLNKYSNIRKELSMQQVGPALGFAPVVRERTHRPVLLIQNAKGGSALSEWEREDSSLTFLDRTLERMLPALKYGKVKGIIWHQGETDVTAGTAGALYVRRFARMIARLRKALGVGSEVPVLVGELGQWAWEDPRAVAAFNDSTLPALTRVVPNCHKVESDGLESRSPGNPGDPHFSRAANLELGRRYAAALLSALGLER